MRVYCAWYACHAADLLTIFRPHRKDCKFAPKGRKHRHCGSPIAVEGMLNGVLVRPSLDRRNWEAAQQKIREWEIHGMKQVANLANAYERCRSFCLIGSGQRNGSVMYVLPYYPFRRQRFPER